MPVRSQWRRTEIATEDDIVITKSLYGIAGQGRNDQQNTERTDQQLLEAFAQGDRATLGILMSRYQCFLKQQCRKFSSGNAEDAKDLFSMVVFKVYTEHPEQLRKIRHMGGWLSRVAQNKAIDLERMRIAEEKRDQRLGHFHEITNAHPSSPEQTLLGHELVKKIQEAFNALPPRLRDAAELRFVEDASYESISAHLGISQANARKRVQEARLRLTQTLQAYRQLTNPQPQQSGCAFALRLAMLDDRADEKSIPRDLT